MVNDINNIVFIIKNNIVSVFGIIVLIGSICLSSLLFYYDYKREIKNAEDIVKDIGDEELNKLAEEDSIAKDIFVNELNRRRKID